MRHVASTYRGLEDQSAYEEIDRLISDACERVRTTLSVEKATLERIADALFKQETLSGKEIRELAAT
jgi:ATP-dependent Zn protease